jgi:hypothetical protein
MGGLEDAVAAPAPGRAEAWHAGVIEAGREVAAQWARHVEGSEDADGLLAEVLFKVPRLAHRVDHLRREHGEITHATEQLLLIPAPTPDDADAATAKLREVALDLLSRIARHRQLGADLVYEAYSVDIGLSE